jgi:type I restriction enzyme S subunit
MYGAGGQKRVPDAFVRNFATAFPPLPEQTQIAAFLDRETAKIDGLVAEQRRLMALLKEKRQAVISHAVTQGLNPLAPMKPSGIEWLGDVPGHWGVSRLSRITTKIGDGLHGTPEYVDESEFYFINGNNLASGVISITDTTRCVSEAERDKHGVELNQSTVLLSINGTIGNFAFYRGESVMLGKSAAYINCGDKVLRDYLCWCMQSSDTRRYFDFSVTGTTIYNLSLDSIRKMPMALPPCEEQVAICTILTDRAGEYDELLQEAQRAIDLLAERRTALISAAVTGQIDVCGAF